MSGNYPDGLNQAMFDEYWADKLDDEEDDDTDMAEVDRLYPLAETPEEK